MWSFLSRNQAIGQLLLRIWLGGFFIYVHGWEKLAGGIDRWRELGRAMKLIGLDFWYPFWGFMATMAETLGMALFVIGLAFRPACLLLTASMTVAAIARYHGLYGPAGGLPAAAHAIEMAIVFCAMMFIGPGKYSVDKQ